MSSPRPTGEEQRAQLREVWKEEYRKRKAYATNLQAAQRENRINAELLAMETALDTDDTEQWARQLNDTSFTAEAKLALALESKGIALAPEPATQTPVADHTLAHLTALERFKLQNGLATEAELGLEPPQPEAVNEQSKSLGVSAPTEPVEPSTKTLGVEMEPALEQAPTNHPRTTPCCLTTCRCCVFAQLAPAHRNSAIMFLRTLLLLLLPALVLAQQPDYTYSNPLLRGFQATFRKADSTFTVTPERGSSVRLALPVGRGLNDYAGIAKEGGNRLTATDMVLVLDALAKWDSAKVFIGFTLLPSGLGYRVGEPGSGPQVMETDSVHVHYRGMLINGRVFDSSFERNQPFTVRLGKGRVIQGWEKGIPLFRVGGKGQLLIPPGMGYGARGAGAAIPPNSYLIFDIEVLSVD
jgi:FKBP-type peptidyl-prolyl cis-trans isomerase